MLGWIINGGIPLIVILENVAGAPWDKMVDDFEDIGYAAEATRFVASPLSLSSSLVADLKTLPFIPDSIPRTTTSLTLVRRLLHLHLAVHRRSCSEREAHPLSLSFFLLPLDQDPEATWSASRNPTGTL